MSDERPAGHQMGPSARKKKHTHITDWSNTSYMYAHQHQYGYENNNHYDFGISGALLSQKHLSFPAVAYEQGFHLKLLESKITRARARLA